MPTTRSQRRKRKRPTNSRDPPQKRRKLADSKNAKKVKAALSDQEYAIERIVDSRTQRGNKEYLVCWIGYPGEDTWEPLGNLPPALITEFKRAQSKPTRRGRRRNEKKAASTWCFCNSSANDHLAMIQCDSCENWLHFSCVGLKRSPPKNAEYLCPNCAENRDADAEISDEEEEKERSDSRSPVKMVRNDRNSTAKMSRSSSVDSDFEGDITSEEDNEEKDESYDPEHEDTLQNDEDSTAEMSVSPKNDLLRSESPSESPPRATRSRSAASIKHQSSSPADVKAGVVSQKTAGQNPRFARAKRRSGIPRINPQKMELDSSDEESDDSSSPVPSTANFDAKPKEENSVDHKWLMSLKWTDIENSERDHEADPLPPNDEYLRSSVLEDTGEVDECNRGIFKLREETEDDKTPSRIHVWRSEAKPRVDLKRDEPLGNFRADYNGCESTELRKYFSSHAARVRCDVVSQIRFNAAGTACLHVTSDWSWMTEIQKRIHDLQSELATIRARLRTAERELDDLERDPSFPFSKQIRNPLYDPQKAIKAARKKQARQNLSDSEFFLLYIFDSDSEDYDSDFTEPFAPNPLFRQYEQATSEEHYLRMRIHGLEERIRRLERQIDNGWKPLTDTVDEWIPASKEEQKRNKRADLSEWFHSNTQRDVLRDEYGTPIDRQKLLEMFSKQGSNKAVARKLERITSISNMFNQAQLAVAVQNRNQFASSERHLFNINLHKVSLTITSLMSVLLPHIPDVIVSLISGYAEDNMCVKDVSLNPSVLLSKLSSSHGILPPSQKFLLPYILETNNPSRGVTLVENREHLFYQSSNVPSVSVRLIEKVGEGLDQVRELDLRGIVTKLFGYQLRSYVWMEDLEEKVLRKHKWYFGCNDLYIDCESSSFDGESTHFPVMCDHVEQEVSLLDDIENENESARIERHLSVSGGVLADEVGLGKTLTTICILFGHRPTLKVLRSLSCVKTTLIIAPSHLLHQWREEMHKHVKREWDIVEIPTKTQYIKMTAQRLYSADVLLVSTQFLKGKFYNDHRLNNKPWLESVKFWRCIVDEGHELVDKGNGKAKANTLKMNAVHYWYLSGTPFPCPEALSFCCEFIRLRVCDRPVVETQFLLRTAVGKVIERMLVDHVVMRNTKVSVDELHIPKRVETPAFVELHPVELGLYKICRDLFPQDARQVCTDIASVDAYRISSLAPDQIQQMALTRNLACGLNVLPRRLAIDRKEQVPRQRTLVSGLEYEIRTEERKQYPDKLVLRAKKRDLAKEKKKLTRFEAEIHFCESSELRMSVEMWKLSHRVNPLRYATLLLGSKFSKAVLWISNLVKSDPNVRIIAFSNFTKVLRNYLSYLKDVMKVKTVFCQGNVYVRRKAVQSFQSDDADPVRVILLSIQKSASGANLTRATHVCLLDPVAASASQAVASEEQAVGRALRQGMSSERNCQIIRFVAKDTIEQDLFERNQKQRKQNEGNEHDGDAL